MIPAWIWTTDMYLNTDLEYEIPQSKKNKVGLSLIIGADA